ncbi:MAG TPA: ATP-binding protein, partial [Gammaproteobacteria bacterium]
AALLPPAGALLLLGALAVWVVDTADHFLQFSLSLLALLVLMQAASSIGRRRQLKLADFLRAEVVRNVVLEQETEAELRDIFQNHPVPMWIFERDSLRILSVNEAACAHYGYGRSEFLHMDMRQLHPVSDVQVLEQHLAQLQAAPQGAGTWKHRRKDDSLIDVEVISHEMRWRGRMARLVAAKDVTRRVSAERRLTEMNTHLAARVRERTLKVRRYAHKLRERKQELEIANRDLEMFCYSASHDLRTPLFVMSTFATLFLEDFGESLPPEAVEHVRKIQAASVHMSSLVGDLMKLAKVSKNLVQARRVDLSQLANAQVDLLRSKEPGRAVDIEVEDELQVDADPGLLEIALENLLGNAWKYTSRNPRARIQVGAGHYCGEDAIFIRDNGAGFDMHAADGLFKPFRRLHSQEQFEGTGIGLAIVQRVIALHGGRVWAEAEPDKGATFYFTLGQGATAAARNTA